jgi:hypothetical protein
MRKRNFVGSSEDILTATIHEEWGRKNDGHVAIVEKTEDQPISGMFNSKHFVPIDEVPESLEDIEESLIEAIDAKETPPETFESMGNPSIPECPKEFKIIKIFRKGIQACSCPRVASIDARSGIIALRF